MADRIKGITIEIGGDTTGLNKALSGTNKEIKNTQSQLKDVERLLKLDPSNTELLKQKQKLLSDAVGETAEKLETLKSAEKQVQKQFAEGKVSEEQYHALKREIIATEQQLDDLKEKAAGANVVLQKIGLAGETVKDLGGKITGAGQGLLKLTAGITAVGAASVKAWETIDDVYDTIAKGTGATGKNLEDLQSSFDKVFSSIPTEAGAAGSAIADINTRFGFTGEILEDCTRDFLKFAEVNNTDVSNAIANVSRYMGDAGIESSKYREVLDQLTAASQSSGISVDKLSETLTKYGAPMRALGLTTQESIAIFAGWEKAGVNTEIAFSGMKKAIGTWGKAGKDASKEFKKTLDEIAKCPDIAAATTKAIEVFGQKAGPDLADAIKGGRFAYEDFLKIVEGSEGQLEQTFQDTLDPIDDVTVAIQGLTAQGAELGGELLKTLAPMITELMEKVEEITAWFKNLNEQQKETVVKVGLLAAALGPVLIVIGQVITGIGSLMTMISGLGTAITLLSASGGPVFLAVAALGAVITAMSRSKSVTDEYREAVALLTPEEEANRKQVDELYQAYQSMNEQREDATQSINAQANQERALFAELQSMVDQNGRVKEGYEERAAFITGQLASALGTEIEITGDQIQNYKDLCVIIDQLIQKKQANALLSANEAAYTEALMNQTNAYMSYNDAKKNVEDSTWAMLKAQEQEAFAADRIRQLWEENIRTGADVTEASAQWSQKQQEAAGTAQGMADKLEGLNTQLQEAEDAYVGYNTVIQNYEGLSSSIISGEQEAIQEAVSRITNNFQTAETATRESLQKQNEDLKAKYAEMKAAVEAGAPGITQAQVDAMAELVKASEAELKKLPEAGKSAGKDMGDGYSEGIGGSTKDVTDASTELADASVKAMRDALQSHSPADATIDVGKDFDDGYVEGIRDNTGLAVDAVNTMISESTAGMKNLPAQANIWAADFMDGYISTMRGKIGELASASEQVASTISSYLHFSRPDVGPLREYETWMPDMMHGLAAGIRDNLYQVGNAAEETADRIGEKLASGIADSVRNNKNLAKKSAEELADAVLKEAKQRLNNEKVYRELSLAEEVDYWDCVRKQVSEGTQARIDADEKYLNAKRDLNSKMADMEESYTDKVSNAYKNLNEKIQNLNEQYRNSVDQRANQIKSSFGLFDEFTTGTDLTADDMLNNLQGQVEGLQKWRSNLHDLERRGVSEELIKELESLGPKAAAEIQIMVDMTDSQLTEYSDLFREKNRIARRQAVEELEPMRDEITDQIGKMQQETAAELSKYQQEYISAMAELGVALNQPLETMKLTAAQNAVALVTTMADTIKDASGSTENVDKFRKIAENVLGATNSLQNDMQTVGQTAIMAIIDGMQSKAEMLYDTAREIAKRVTKTMEETFEMQMPTDSMTRNASRQSNGPGEGYAGSRAASEILNRLDSYLPEIAQQKYIALNGKKLVGETVGDIDSQISMSQNMRARVIG